MKYSFLYCLLFCSLSVNAQVREVILNRSTAGNNFEIILDANSFIRMLTKGEMLPANILGLSCSVPYETVQALSKKAKGCIPSFFWKKNPQGVAGLNVPTSANDNTGIWEEDTYISTDEKGNATYHLQIRVVFEDGSASSRQKVKKIVVLCGKEIKPIDKNVLAALLKKDREENAAFPPPPTPPPPPGSN